MDPESQNELFAIRRAKLDALRALGVDPFGGRFDPSGSVAEIRARFAEGNTERAAGRITAHRDMGRSHFLDLNDGTDRIQLFVSTKELSPAQVELFKLLDLADFIGVEAECFVTKTGEPSLRVKNLTLLSKALRPLPSAWYGLADVEHRYRQRYVDLLVNPASREVFLKRIRIVREIREFLHARGFLEVETPMMQAVAGGAAAQPFTTHHNALGLDLHLRIAPELYLKRLLVGGFTKIFELNRNFRNEGISRRHNPEFTMLEAYWAFADFELMADLVEELICHLAQTIHGSLLIEHKDSEGKVVRTIDLTRPWRRASYRDLVREAAGADWFDLSPEARRERAGFTPDSREPGVGIAPHIADFEVTQHMFEKLVEAETFNPLFVTHCPAELVPLARQNSRDPSTVDVYELIINGQEISPGYSELNDPIVQRERLEHQAGEEKQKIDEDFLTALEHGMPPAGGIGIGIDRLVMMLTGAESIRDVILFPQLKPPQRQA
jgi:lysyl-tRNA synthetase class 2